MICFNESLANYARTIINTRSTADEIKAAYDIAQAENMLGVINQQLSAFGQISLDIYNSAVELDSRLRQDYKEIDGLQACANRLHSLAPSQNRTANPGDYIAYRLGVDVHGILVATLLKHKVIEKIDESLQQVCQ